MKKLMYHIGRVGNHLLTQQVFAECLLCARLHLGTNASRYLVVKSKVLARVGGRSIQELTLKDGWGWLWSRVNGKSIPAVLYLDLQNTTLYLILPHSKYKPLSFQNLVVKPDQLIKRRGKLGLVGVNLTLDGVKSWLKPRLGQEATVSGHGVRGTCVVTCVWAY